MFCVLRGGWSSVGMYVSFKSKVVKSIKSFLAISFYKGYSF
jgi:hypothetical protein